MLNSKNLVSKLLLTVTMLSSLSLYCAQAAPAGDSAAKIATNAAAASFKALVEEAKQALKLVSSNASTSPLEQQLSDPKLVHDLKDFAQKFLAAKAAATPETARLLEPMETVDFEGKPIIQALKAAFLEYKYQKIATDNLFLIQILADINGDHWKIGQSLSQIIKERKNVNLIPILKALGGN
jgi:hypothetical protein